MQLSKKLYTTLIIAVLTVSTLMAAIPMASAIAGPPALFTTPTTPGAPPATVQTSGPVGSGISLIANATDGTPAAAYSTVTAYWDSQTGTVLGTGSADGDGYYRIDVVIPSAVVGDHAIIVNDGFGADGVTFTVTPSLTASTTPPTGDTTYDAKVLPGDALTIVGHGYAGGFGGSDMNITIEGPQGTLIITSPAITTNSTGSFSAVITIPTVAVANYSDYVVNGTDESDNYATAPILIDYYITVSPQQGPPGVTITISGRIPASMPYTLRIDATTIASGTSGTDGQFTNAYTIPALIADGGHTVSVRWVVGTVESVKDTTFTVGPAPTLSGFSATAAVAGTVITFSGAGFSDRSNITLYLGSTIVNSTATDSRFGPTSAAGTFTNLQFTVPAIAAGVYTLTVTDVTGASTGTVYTFTVNPTPVTNIAISGASYFTGDTISFTITTTEGDLGLMSVTIRDPSGAIWWSVVNAPTTADTGLPWSLTTVSGVSKSILFQDQTMRGNAMNIPAAAPLGSWNWTITYTATSTYPVVSKATGLFTVAALPTMQTVLDRLDDMEATITDVITTTENDIIAVVNTKTGTIMTDISSLDAQLTSIDGGIATISTSIGDIQTTLAGLSMDALGADITTIKNGVATIQTNLGTVSTAVSNLDAKLTNVQGDVATVLTNLGTLDGKVTSIDGKVATVETDVGTIQADVSDVKASADQTPVWIAVVLSLVAAIAAIFAVITIRQKIAG
jgi:hypothetical protein